MNIRPLGAGDLPEVAALEERAGDVGWSFAQWERELRLDVSRFFVVENDSHGLLAYAGYWKVAEEAQIANVVVRPESRRLGVGRKLLTHLLDRARAEGCRRSTLEVRKGNAAARALYEQLGFSTVGERQRVYTNPSDDAWLMEKNL